MAEISLTGDNNPRRGLLDHGDADWKLELAGEMSIVVLKSGILIASTLNPN